jgi:hypothetical protein
MELKTMIFFYELTVTIIKSTFGYNMIMHYIHILHDDLMRRKINSKGNEASFKKARIFSYVKTLAVTRSTE